MEYTNNYTLKKPGYMDLADIQDINDNADIIDQKLKEIEDSVENIEVPVNSVNGKTGDVELTASDVGAASQEDFESHKNDNTKHVTLSERNNWNSKADANIREDSSKILKVEVVSSSDSETPETGRIIFDTSQGKFLGGNGSEWV